MRIIHWAGDSTVTVNKYMTWPQTGIAQAFDRYTAEDVLIDSHAINGRSTKSFVDQGRLAKIEACLSPGDFLFIQFGHNDEKEEDPDRYTDPDTSFVEHLKLFHETAVRHGAHPLFITPVERRLFERTGGLVPSAHTPYANAMIRTAGELQVPVVDLCRISRSFLNAEGDAATAQYYMNTAPGEYRRSPEGQTDNTHLKYEGAMLYAGMIARAVRTFPEPYASLIIGDLDGDTADFFPVNRINEGFTDG